MSLKTALERLNPFIGKRLETAEEATERYNHTDKETNQRT